MADGNTTIGRDANAGRDFAGRDRTGSGDGSSSSHVDIYTDPYRDQRHPSGDSNAEILEALRRAVIGDPYNPAQPGIVRSLAELSASMSAFHAWRTAADAERASLGRDIIKYQAHTNQRLETTDSRLTAIMVIVWATVAFVGIEAVAIIWLFVQRSITVIGG